MPNGGGQSFFGGAIVTGKCTQLTIAIMGCATIFRMGYKTAVLRKIFSPGAGRQSQMRD